MQKTIWIVSFCSLLASAYVTWNGSGLNSGFSGFSKRTIADNSITSDDIDLPSPYPEGQIDLSRFFKSQTAATIEIINNNAGYLNQTYIIKDANTGETVAKLYAGTRDKISTMLPPGIYHLCDLNGGHLSLAKSMRCSDRPILLPERGKNTIIMNGGQGNFPMHYLP